MSMRRTVQTRINAFFILHLTRGCQAFALEQPPQGNASCVLALIIQYNKKHVKVDDGKNMNRCLRLEAVIDDVQSDWDPGRKLTMCGV